MMPDHYDDAQNSPRHRANKPALLMLGLGVLIVVVSFWFWHEVWFGRHLSEDEVGQYLSDSKSPRKIQHALSQIADRIMQRDPSVQRWYAQVIEAAKHEDPAIRVMAAWVMGHDHTADRFHQALLALLDDPDLRVRRNAALSLVRFGDSSGHEEIVSMLRPITITAPTQGRVMIDLSVGQIIGAGDLVCKIVGPDGQTIDVRTPASGKIQAVSVKDGSLTGLSDVLATIAPDQQVAWEALRGLFLIGTEEDIDEIERYVLDAPDVAEPVRQQAKNTVEAIRKRSARNPTH
ncbi:MAG: HEAT repeat domain-containing protein [Blastocatellia bacterium]|nr:HEAT repeat domain-containing protein [Blastocatellia bacterium]